MKSTVGWFLLLYLLPSTAALDLPRDTNEVATRMNLTSEPTLLPLEGRGPAADLPDLPRHGAIEGNNPWLEFLSRLRNQPQDAPTQLGSWVSQLFDEGARPRLPAGYDEINKTATLSFTYNLGDINGDGYTDVGFDIRCVDWDTCDQPDGVEELLYPVCSLQHWFEARSGRDGSILWTHRLDAPYPLPHAGLACSFEFVMGLLPQGDGTQEILVYRWQFVYAFAAFVFHHEIYLLDGRGEKEHGKVLWMVDEDGYADTWFRHANNVLVWPILQAPRDYGIPLKAPGTTTTLFLRGIGWVADLQSGSNRCGDPNCLDNMWDLFLPQEWASSIDVVKGKERWRTTTFLPETDRSTFVYSYGEWPGWAWFNQACCGDLTGDGEPDLIFSTDEVTPIQATHTLADRYLYGPNQWDSHLIVYDAKTGDRLLKTQVAHDVKTEYFFAWVRWVGDATGDDRSDLFHYQVTFNLTEEGRIVNLRILARMFDGADLHVRWSLESNKTFPDYIVLGDVDTDGGNDVFVAYYDLGRDIVDGLTNVTDTRLVAHNGAEGTILWETLTKAAPMDIAAMFLNTGINGLLDLNGDGVAEVWIDQPDQLDDLTVLHHTSFLSGRDGGKLLTVDSAGAFAFPIRARDLDGDGGNDFTITQGDFLDFWVAAYNGHDGAPLWSRRALEIPSGGGFFGLPLLQYHSMELDGNATRADLLLSTTVATITCGGGRCGLYLYQQHHALQGSTGKLLWALPELPEGDLSLHLGEPTPATAQYTGWTKSIPLTKTSHLQWAPLPVLMGVSGAGTLALSFVAARRLRRPRP